jgi:hypothetical protein
MNALLLALLCTVGQTKDEYVQDFHHDFRGELLPETLGLQPFNYPALAVEKEGLRITLPKNRKQMGQVGVFTTFPVKGNFEITAAYEILHADQPTDGWGVGVTLYAYVDAPVKNAVGIYRLDRPKGVRTIHWDCALTGAGGQREYSNDRVDSDARVFRLRMTRNKKTVTLFWAPGLVGDEFRAIGKTEFVSDDLKTVALNTTTGSKPFDLEARFVDLRIRSGVKSLSEGELTLSLGERVRRRWRLVVVLLLAGFTMCCVLLTWVWRRRRQVGDNTDNTDVKPDGGKPA